MRSSGDSRLPVVVAYGTRPEAVKLAPVIVAMQRSGVIRPDVVVSGQHREMLDQVNQLFGISPAVDLDISTPGQTLTEITTRALAGYSAYLESNAAAAVVVQGDTTTTLAASLAAFYHQIPVVHVEAGLRTDNPRSPFPEEVNRRLTTQLASLHLAPTALNRANLLREGIADRAVRVTGNTVIDAFLTVTQQTTSTGIEAVDHAIADRRRVIVLTAHRRESWGEPMRAVGRATAQLARAFPDVLVVVPVHRNPLVREQLVPPLRELPNVLIVEPMDYGPFCALIAGSTLVLTDSGGVQEEAPSVGKPVLVLRDTTERGEAVSRGTVELVGTSQAAIVERASRLLSDGAAYAAMAHAVNPYGDGHAAPRSVAAVEAFLGVGDYLADFAAD